MGVGQCGPLGSPPNSPVADSGTMCIASTPTPGPTCNALDFYLNDELTPVAVYMAAEMTTNAHGGDVERMRALNRFSPEACISDFTRLPLWRQALGLGLTPEQCVQMGMSNHSAALLT